MTVFISHSFENKPEFENVVEALKNAGVAYWDPVDVKPGLLLRDQLRKAIECCNVCIFIATHHSMQSSWCGAELGAFWGASKPVIVYVAESTLKEAQLPPIIQGDVWERRIKRVVERARELTLQKETNEDSQTAVPNLDDSTINQVTLAVSAITGYLGEAEALAARNQGLAFALMQTLSSWRLVAADWSKAEVRISESSATNLVVRKLYSEASFTVFSTCAEQYLAQWNTPHGDSILRSHKISPAKVIRVFLFSTRADIDSIADQIFTRHSNAGIDVRIFINDETAFNFPPELSQDFTVIDEGAAIGVTTAFTAAFSGEPQTQATWYFDNTNRIDSYNQMILGLTADDVMTFDQYRSSVAI